MFILFLLFVGASAGCPYYEAPGDCPNLVHTKITNTTNCLAECQALGGYDNTGAFFNGMCYCLEDGFCDYDDTLPGTIIAQDSERVCCDGSALPEGACDCDGNVLDECGVARALQPRHLRLGILAEGIRPAFGWRQDAGDHREALVIAVDEDGARDDHHEGEDRRRRVDEADRDVEALVGDLVVVARAVARGRPTRRRRGWCRRAGARCTPARSTPARSTPARGTAGRPLTR